MNYYRVGISGHRDLKTKKIKVYTEELKKYLLILKQKETKKELLILTTLAEGADRLIAKVALSLGLSYDVLLPMPKEIYLKDFSKQSQLEFLALLKQAHSVKTIKLYAANSFNLINKPSLYRDFQYRQVGREIVERADEMIVMGDGVENNKIGGTSDIANYAKSYGTLTFTIQCDRQCA